MIIIRKDDRRSVKLVFDDDGARALLELCRSASLEEDVGTPVTVLERVFRSRRNRQPIYSSLQIMVVEADSDQSLTLDASGIRLLLDPECVRYLAHNLEKCLQLPAHYFLPEFTTLALGSRSEVDLYCIHDPHQGDEWTPRGSVTSPR